MYHNTRSAIAQHEVVVWVLKMNCVLYFFELQKLSRKFASYCNPIPPHGHNEPQPKKRVGGS